jgi:hypothetical protein
VRRGCLRCPTDSISPKDRGVAVRVTGVQQVGCVCGSADQEVLAIDLQIEIAALAEFGELLVLVAELLN